LEFAVDGATRMRILISGLVEYARIDKQAKPFKVIRTNALADRVINNLSLFAHDKKVKITREELPDFCGDEVQLNRLFQKFSRTENSFAHTPDGSGLGLYWAKEIVKLHGGAIELESQYGQGRTFTIIIPHVALPAPEARAETTKMPVKQEIA
jgi:signal transduction histidine kinase